MRNCFFAFFFILFSINGIVHAEDYNECRAACDKAFNACISQSSAFTAVNPGLFAEAQAECRGKLDKCNAECRGLQKEEEGLKDNRPSSPSSQEEE